MNREYKQVVGDYSYRSLALKKKSSLQKICENVVEIQPK